MGVVPFIRCQPVGKERVGMKVRLCILIRAKLKRRGVRGMEIGRGMKDDEKTTQLSEDKVTLALQRENQPVLRFCLLKL